MEDARNVLETVLSKWPDDGFALVHYGFILKTKDNNLKDAVEYMTKGLQTRAPGVTDGRFYFHLGDALTRLGKKSEALKVIFSQKCLCFYIISFYSYTRKGFS